MSPAMYGKELLQKQKNMATALELVGAGLVRAVPMAKDRNAVGTKCEELCWSMR